MASGVEKSEATPASLSISQMENELQDYLDANYPGESFYTIFDDFLAWAYPSHAWNRLSKAKKQEIWEDRHQHEIFRDALNLLTISIDLLDTKRYLDS